MRKFTDSEMTLIRTGLRELQYAKRHEAEKQQTATLVGRTTVSALLSEALAAELLADEIANKGY